MNLLGIHLTLLIGRKIPVPPPAPLTVIEALQSVEVTHSDQGPSGFQLTFHVGRSSALDLLDYRLLRNDLIKPFSRVIIIVRFAVAPQVLMDGIVTNLQLNPSNEPGASTLTLTGEDVSVMMDMEEKSQEYPGMSDSDIIRRLLVPYIGRFGLRPDITETTVPPPNTNERTPQQSGTDRGYIQELAQGRGFVFYVTPGQAPGSNQVYWGPPVRLGEPQRALSVNMGPNTNVESINFRFNALAPTQVAFRTEDRPERTLNRPGPTRLPLTTDRAELARIRRLSEASRFTDAELEALAQGMVDESLDEVVAATGELDALRYNGLLKPRGVVGVRGVGQSFNGVYYVKSVTHRISKGEYKQNFTLTREGTGTLTPFLPS